MANPLEEMRARAQRVFGSGPVSSAVRRVRAIVGPLTFPDLGDSESQLTALAQAGLDALRAEPPEEPTPKQFQALQILIQLSRPAVPTKKGAFGTLPSHVKGGEDDIEDRTGAWSSLSTKLGDFLYSIGRIDGPRGERHYGTGFLIADDLLMTNKHVLQQMTAGTERLAAGQAQVNFQQEWGEPDTDGPVPVEGVHSVHETLDLAILKVSGVSQRPRLSFGVEEPSVGAEIATIGYPYKDPVNSPAMMDRIFENRYGVKQVAPGEVTGARDDRLFHDCSTLGGNSGSPVVDFGTGNVVAVHRSGHFMWRNEAVLAREAAAFAGQGG